MIAPRGTCDRHSEVISEVAVEVERARALEDRLVRERDVLAEAIERIDGRLGACEERIRGLEATVQRWGGVIATVAAAPLVIQLFQALLKVVER